MVSCGSDGSVKVWDVSPGVLLVPSSSGAPTSEGSGKLLLTWGYNGTDASTATPDASEKAEAYGATSLAEIRTDLRKIAVAYRNAVVKIFDLETGKETARLPSDVSYGNVLFSSRHQFNGANYWSSRWHRANADKQDCFPPNGAASRDCSRRPLYSYIRLGNWCVCDDYSRNETFLESSLL